jgi:nucleotide-binding universal stress UspA family protein
MKERTIIVGFDGSEPSIKALDFARDQAHKFDASIMLVHVIDWSPFEFRTHQENEEQAQSRREQIKNDREQLFPPVLSELKAAGISAIAGLKYGQPAEVLAELAEECDAFSIVVGRKGTSNLKTILFGSVASHVVQQASCPVTVVP